MKKFLSLINIICIVFMTFIFSIKVNAADTPVYDETYNNNTGAFYANGTSISISEIDGNTVITWDGGSQIVPETVTIFGGGAEGTSYETSDIVMESGTVSYIYGGGFSVNENSSAYVTTSNVVVNGGSVLGTVYGGGLVYAEVGTSNVTINGGTISAVAGGGGAFAQIDGTSYSAGTADDAQNSKNRVDTVNVTINGGTIYSESANYGLVYGGGQGYSYTGSVNLVITGGDMTKAYITAGGSNGYTEVAEVAISGGDINIYQSVNRGTVNEAKLTVTGGTITNVYAGGETRRFIC